MQMRSQVLTIMAAGLMALTPLWAQTSDQDQPKGDQPAAASSQQQPENQQAAPEQQPQSQPQAASSPESELLSKMHAANQMEIKAGHLAESKGTTAQIRNYGALLVRDHSLADKKISMTAKQQNISLMPPMPKSPDEKQQMEMQKQAIADLEQAQGQDFDRKFVAFNSKAHDMAIAMVRKGSDQLKPSPVKKLTSMMIPILEQHNTLAKHLEERQTASK